MSHCNSSAQTHYSTAFLHQHTRQRNITPDKRNDARLAVFDQQNLKTFYENQQPTQRTATPVANGRSVSPSVRSRTPTGTTLVNLGASPSSTLKNSNSTYYNFDCGRAGHDRSPLNVVCFDNACENKGLLCTICQHLEHYGHETLPMKIFMEQVRRSVRASEKVLEAANDQIATLINHQTQALNSFDDAAQKIIESLNGMKQRISFYFQQELQPFQRAEMCKAECEEILKIFSGSLNRTNSDVFGYMRRLAEMVGLQKAHEQLNSETFISATENLNPQQSFAMASKVHDKGETENVNQPQPQKMRRLSLHFIPIDLEQQLTHCIKKCELVHWALLCELDKITADFDQKVDTIYSEVTTNHLKYAQLRQATHQRTKYRVELNTQINCHQNVIRDMVQLDENRLATCSYDKSVKIYNFRTANLVAALQEHTDEVYQLAVSKKHRLLASSSYDQTVRVWKEYSTWKLLITLRGHTGKTWALTFLDNIDRLASGSKDQSIIIWNIYNGHAEQVLRGHTLTVWSLYATENGQTLLSGDNSTLRIWDVRTFALSNAIQAHKGRIYRIVENVKQGLVITGSLDHTIKFWDNKSYVLMRTIQELLTITSLRVVDEYNLLLVGLMGEQRAGGVCLYSCKSFAREGQCLYEQNTESDQKTTNTSSGVTSIFWDQKKQHIVSGHCDGVVNLVWLSRRAKPIIQNSVNNNQN